MQAYSENPSERSKSTIHFYNQTSIFMQENDTEYHEDQQGIRTNSAIRALRNSAITLDLASEIYGDVIAGRGIEVDENANDKPAGGEITIKSIDGGTFKGDYLAGNDGKIDLTLNNGSSLEGRIDDYADASLNGTVFRPEEFNVDVTDGGTVNLNLNNST